MIERVEIEYTSPSGAVYKGVGWSWTPGEPKRTHERNGDPADPPEARGFEETTITMGESTIDITDDLSDTIVESILAALEDKAEEENGA